MTEIIFQRKTEEELQHKLLDTIADTMLASALVNDAMATEVETGGNALAASQEACRQLADVYRAALAGLEGLNLPQRSKLRASSGRLSLHH